jgi:orotate phosphoribosyltransferase
MENYQIAFVELALRVEALRFGEFTLKSGRVSPYFFNAGEINSGAALAELGRCYAAAIEGSGIDFDILFGPAYKGIPLVSASAVALADGFGRDIPICYNRKEAKDHGEGGSLVGAGIAGKRVLIVDDVITAGTAIGEVMTILEREGAEPAGVVIGLDRRERGHGLKSAVQEVEARYGIPVTSIIAIDDLIRYLERRGDDQDVLTAMRDYRRRYGTESGTA